MPEQQKTVVKATRTPHKVKWPDWWEKELAALRLGASLVAVCHVGPGAGSMPEQGALAELPYDQLRRASPPLRAPRSRIDAGTGSFMFDLMQDMVSASFAFTIVLLPETTGAL